MNTPGSRLAAIALLFVPVRSGWTQPSPADAHSSPSAPASKGSVGADSSRQDRPSGYVKVYCDGVGSNNSGVDCPCGNTLPPGSNTGCANRTGHGASLTPTGVASISHDTLALTATGLPPGVPGYFFYSTTTGGPVSTGNGTRCIGPGARLRKVAHSSSSDGFPAPNTPPISQQLNLSAGASSYFQVLYRDQRGPCGGRANATNAVMVIWGT